MRLEAKRAFVLADWMKSASRCESEEEFLVLLYSEQKRVAALAEAQIDQVLARHEPRLIRFQTRRWELGNVALSECYVWPEMGKRPWAVGRVSEVAAAFRELESTTSRIWKMKLFARMFTHLPLIILQTEQRLDIDDGSHRAVAMYLREIQDAPAYIGIEEN